MNTAFNKPIISQNTLKTQSHYMMLFKPHTTTIKRAKTIHIKQHMHILAYIFLCCTETGTDNFTKFHINWLLEI